MDTRANIETAIEMLNGLEKQVKMLNRLERQIKEGRLFLHGLLGKMDAMRDFALYQVEDLCMESVDKKDVRELERAMRHIGRVVEREHMREESAMERMSQMYAQEKEEKTKKEENEPGERNQEIS